MVAKIEAPLTTVDALLGACTEVEREVYAYQERVGAYKDDHQRMDSADEGRVRQPAETQQAYL